MNKGCTKTERLFVNISKPDDSFIMIIKIDK